MSGDREILLRLGELERKLDHPDRPLGVEPPPPQAGVPDRVWQLGL